MNLKYSRVTKGYKHLEHHTSLLVTCEIMRARATLHLSGTVSNSQGDIKIQYALTTGRYVIVIPQYECNNYDIIQVYGV